MGLFIRKLAAAIVREQEERDLAAYYTCGHGVNTLYRECSQCGDLPHMEFRETAS
ncbi:hypothetical protein [Pseudoclavibacter sp. AY1H1]|uniref:hypothetical protein n=1 Tax=Pseudoclavibacter sp. AY1H1 TaxID=2080584 RepID=UPI0015E28D01|nr:hypothetical protein [Pseudoclavibacter sp. AY1H1]